MELFEKKKMWMATERLDFCEVDVLVSNEGNMLFQEDGEGYYTPNSTVHFFDTKEEANAWLENQKADLKRRMPEIRHFIEVMEDIHPSEDFQFDREEYLGIYVASRLDGLREDNDCCQKIIDILGKAIAENVLNINGVTVKLSNVKRIEWHNDSATVVCDSREITTNGSAEYCALQRIFGRNQSGRIIPKENKGL